MNECIPVAIERRTGTLVRTRKALLLRGVHCRSSKQARMMDNQSSTPNFINDQFQFFEPFLFLNFQVLESMAIHVLDLKVKRYSSNAKHTKRIFCRFQTGQCALTTTNKPVLESLMVVEVIRNVCYL